MKSAITRDKKRRTLFKNTEEKRLALKILQRMYPEMYKESAHKVSAPADRLASAPISGVTTYNLRIQKYLNELPQNSSRTRIRNRCVLTGRSRSIWRTFRISRIQLRKLACEGILMGVKKASW